MTNPDPVYWCGPCRRSDCGTVHCAHPNECGGMAPLSRDDPDVKEALRIKGENMDGAHELMHRAYHNWEKTCSRSC